LPSLVAPSPKNETATRPQPSHLLFSPPPQARGITPPTKPNSPTKPKPPDDTRIERGAIRAFRHRSFLYNCPARKGIEKRLQLRVHNSLLAAPVLEDGWLVYHDLNPRLFVVGENLIGAVLSQSTSDQEESVRIEKLELQVRYQAND
ncbi:MAG: hypothetical protein OXI92_02495, partial [Acidobacteriota bacterium]|nr:hypothetical protein [Acidobacteriota bacterium]